MSGFFGDLIVVGNNIVNLPEGNSIVPITSFLNSIFPAVNDNGIAGFEPPEAVQDQFILFYLANADQTFSKSIIILANNELAPEGFRFLGPTDYTLAPLESALFAYSPGVGCFAQKSGSFA